MKLYLIRHGETVDNIAGLYAGSRDSQLTNYGFEQAKRLGTYFAKQNVNFTHIYASPLSRAFNTAEAVRKAQKSAIDVVKVQELVEKDFGSLEGKAFAAKSDWSKTGKDGLETLPKSGHGFVASETAGSLAKRGDKFLDSHLIPLLGEDVKQECVVAVVSHGMLLSSLWRRLLLRLPRKSLTIAPEIVAAQDNLVLEHLGGWSNTGYLELVIHNPDTQSAAVELPEQVAHCTSSALAAQPLLDKRNEVFFDYPSQEHVRKSSSVPDLSGWSTIIVAIDSRAHLRGLKRQRGGIGSLAHDEGQRKLDGFFSRRKLE